MRCCTECVVVGSTVVDAINDGDDVDPEGGGTTLKTGGLVKIPARDIELERA